MIIDKKISAFSKNSKTTILIYLIILTHKLFIKSVINIYSKFNRISTLVFTLILSMILI